MFLQIMIRDFFRLFFPQLCINCKCTLVGNTYLCIRCFASLLKTDCLKYSPNIAEQKFEEINTSVFCDGASLFYFNKTDAIQSIIHSLKYEYHPQIGIWMGKLMGQCFLQYLSLLQVDYLIPVPLHKSKEKKRRYNQSLLICQGIQQITHLPIDDNALLRIKKTEPQAKLHSQEKRMSNIKDAFIFSNIKSKFDDKSLVLIDDVLTTGATLSACGQAIKNILPNVNLRFLTFAIA